MKKDLHVGDLIVASSGPVTFAGEIICGWSAARHEFVTLDHAKCDPGEFIAVRLIGEPEQVRIRPELWDIHCGPELVRAAKHAA